MLKDKLKSKLIEARRRNDRLEMMLLQVVLGDADLVRVRNGKEVTDEQLEKIIRNVRDNNQETINLIHDKDEIKAAALVSENVILDSLLPKTMSLEEIKSSLQEIKSDLLNAKSEGAAIGIAMKLIKSKNLKALGDDVKKAVIEIKAE